MGILWLIIKIILWALLLVLVLVTLSLCIVLFTPIGYQIVFEKYEQIDLKVQINFSKLLKVRACFENEKLEVKVTFLKWCIYPRKPKKAKDSVKTIKRRVEPEVKKEQRPSSKKLATREINQKTPTRTSLKENTPLSEDRKHVSKKIVEKKKVEETDSHLGESIKSILLSKETWCFSKKIIKLIGKILKVFKPYALYFDLLIGLEDPGETGILIAKLTMLYPWYFRYGSIQGNYEEEGLWGEGQVEGQFRIINLISILIGFILDKETRKYIHLLIVSRKEEKNGK